MHIHSRTLRVGLLASAVCLLSASDAAAQSARPISLQLSATGLVVSGGVVPGAEVQVRYTANRGSLGGGYQAFVSGGARSDVLFLEPRLRLAVQRRAAVYGAARIGVVRATSTLVFGGGGGVLFAASPKVALDLGAQVYTADATSVISQVRMGLSFGL
jgi:hypothetical protein